MKRILIINQYSSNKGDRAVLYSLLRLLEPYGDCQINVSASTPAEWENQFEDRKINIVPWGWDYSIKMKNPFVKFGFFLLRRIKPLTYSILRSVFVRKMPAILVRPLINPSFYIAARNSDLIISTGGHHITTLLARNAISSQLFDLACCMLMKKRVILWSQSIGPLEFSNSRNERFVRKVLQGVEVFYAREKKSSELAISMGMDPEKVKATYETVISLNDLAEYEPDPERKNTIGISIYSTITRSSEELKNYVAILSNFVDYCVERLNCEVLFIPMELKGSGPDDRWLIDKVISSTKNRNNCSVVDKDLDTLTHFKLVQECRYFVGHKTHSVIFALAAGTPLIALAYHPKTIEFMTQYGLNEYVICDNELNENLLISSFIKMTQNAPILRELIILRSREIADIIRYDFNTIIQSV